MPFNFSAQRIKSLIEDQYFENGSIKAYLERLLKL